MVGDAGQKEVRDPVLLGAAMFKATNTRYRVSCHGSLTEQNGQEID